MTTPTPRGRVAIQDLHASGQVRLVGEDRAPRARNRRQQDLCGGGRSISRLQSPPDSGPAQRLASLRKLIDRTALRPSCPTVRASRRPRSTRRVRRVPGSELRTFTPSRLRGHTRVRARPKTASSGDTGAACGRGCRPAPTSRACAISHRQKGAGQVPVSNAGGSSLPTLTTWAPSRGLD
jgi:hypothetical protein